MEKQNNIYTKSILSLVLALFLINSSILRADEKPGAVRSTPEAATSPSESGATKPEEDSPFTVSADNLCWNGRGDHLKGKNFSTYSKFGFGKDGKFYGLSKGKLKQKDLDKNLIATYEIQDGVKVLDPVATINNFLKKEGLTEDYCPASPSGAAPVQAGSIGTSTPSGGGGGVAGGTSGSSNSGSEKRSNGGNDKKSLPAKECHEANKADSYVLAMSWQPAFCITKPDKPECKGKEFTNNNLHSANNFSIHGLWPNRTGCGQDYGFCNPDRQQEKSFSDYPDVNMSPQTRDFLKELMPSLKAQSHLERHEWYKHGTCSGMDEDDYFTLVGKLVEEFNSYPFMTTLRGNGESAIGTTKSIDLDDLKKQIDTDERLGNGLPKGLGAGVSSSLIFVCKKSKKGEPFLVEIQLNLKSTLTKDSTLKGSIDTTKKGYVRGCGSKGSKINIVPYGEGIPEAAIAQ